MIVLYQEHWFGIPFESFAKLSSKEMPNEDFYEKFYNEFHKKFTSFDDLPDSYKQSKSKCADFLLEIIKNKNSAISIGCGNGFIENRILNNIGGGQLVVIEPSLVASKWIREKSMISILNGFFPAVLKEQLPEKEFDFAYTCAVDYVFNNKEYIGFLQSIIEYGIKDYVCMQPCIQEDTSMKFLAKYFIKKVLSYFGLYDLKQKWGYMRTIDEHIEIFKQAGFKKISYGCADYGSKLYWIRGQDE